MWFCYFHINKLVITSVNQSDITEETYKKVKAILRIAEHYGYDDLLMEALMLMNFIFRKSTMY